MVGERFVTKLNNEPSLREPQHGIHEKKCTMWLNLFENRVLDYWTAGATEFSPEEIEQIGEFIAFAVVRGPDEAIVVDPERASLIYDFLPRDLVDGAGIPPDKFNELYFKATGRRRIRRPISS